MERYKKIGDFYLGIPENIYNTSLEKAIIGKLESQFPEFEIENPNQEHHRREVLRYENLEGKCGKDYLFEEVLPQMVCGGVFLTYEDGKMSWDLFAQAEFLQGLEREIYGINLKDGVISPLELNDKMELSEEETKEREKNLNYFE